LPAKGRKARFGKSLGGTGGTGGRTGGGALCESLLDIVSGSTSRRPGRAREYTTDARVAEIRAEDGKKIPTREERKERIEVAAARRGKSP
jgi:hypothetical protein